MKRRWLASIAVAVALLALIVFKETTRSESASAEMTAEQAAQTRVVLIADPREAESTCGCGKIIRMVRSAGAAGVAVLEIPPGSHEAREYRATVNPTVLFLNEAGAVSVRYEGEGPETIAQIQRGLQEARRQ